MTTLQLLADPLPLRATADGVVFVGESRVTLETVIAAFHGGAGPEEIVRRYPAVNTSDIYAVIGYYLSHRLEIDAYLADRERQSLQVQEENERRFNPQGVRDRLMQRKSSEDRTS